MKDVLLLLLFGISAGVDAGHFFVIGPNLMRFQHDETVLVSVFGETNFAVKVWLEHNGRRISEKDVVVPNEREPVTITLRINEYDIFDNNIRLDKPRTIKLVARDRTYIRKEVELVLSYHTGFLIVQTDKPVYRPHEIVRVRILTLDEALVPIVTWEASMDIISPANLTMGRVYRRNDDTFFTHDFALTPHPEIGIWTILARYNGQFETTSQALFQVQEYVAPRFGVEIDVDPPYILQDTRAIKVNVKATYVYGRPVQGNVGLSTFVQNKKYRNRVPVLNMARETLSWDGTQEFIVTVEDIIRSLRSDNQEFMNGYHLEIIANVFESATGNEVSASHERTVFAIKPYVVKFTRSKSHFRPGMEYYLKIDTFLANGDLAKRIAITVKMLYNNRVIQTLTTQTDAYGQAVLVFSTWQRMDIQFEALDELVISQRFTVRPYLRENQIQVEQFMDNGDLGFKVLTNQQRGKRYTGLLVVIISRGKIVYTKFEEPTNRRAFPLSRFLLEEVTPGARLLVFYVDKQTNELVADSIRFFVEAKCRGQELTLSTTRYIKPGEHGLLIIKGSPFMLVGLNVMDKALLQINSENVMRRSKMFTELDSHDLGCGEGSGENVEETFKNTGLIVISNAAINVDNLNRKSENCDENIRRKRSVDANPAYRSFSSESDYEIDLNDLERMPRTRSDFRESWIFEQIQLDENGMLLKHLNYPQSITEWMIQAVGITNRNGMCISEPMNVTASRDFFIRLELPDKAVRFEQIDVKATIFNYDWPGSEDKTVSLYMQGQNQVCSNTRPGKQSPRKRVSLPPNSAQTVTFPIVPLKCGLFKITISAIVTNLGIATADVKEESLFVVNEGIEQHRSIQLCLDPGKQMKYCENDDDVELEWPGIDVPKQVLTVNFRIPVESIPDTGLATGYITGDAFNDVLTLINGVDKLFEDQRRGNVEMDMKYLAISVYAMTYLKHTKSVDDRVEVIGNEYIRDGVKRVLTYRHPDGSYATFLTRPSSTWLTAFVAKVFCQAQSIVDDAVQENMLAIDWLTTKQNTDGSFFESQPIMDRESLGQLTERDPSFTAFLLISMSECQSRTPLLEDSMQKARQYIEKLNREMLRSNPYLLAISTYALSLTNSEIGVEFKTLLYEIKHTHGEYIYWGIPGGEPASAQSIETTSYALLATLMFEDFKTSADIVRWLTSQRHSASLFRNTHELVIGLQALAQYHTTARSRNMNLGVTILSEGWSQSGKKMHITKENAQVQKIVTDLPIRQFFVEVIGTGTGRMVIDLRYNIPSNPDELCPFYVSEVQIDNVFEDIDVHLFPEIKCDICGNCENHPVLYDMDNFGDSSFSPVSRPKANKCMKFQVSSKSDEEHGMSVVHVGLEAGLKVIESDLKKLENEKIISRYEIPSTETGYIIFFVDKIGPVPIPFIFRLLDEFEGDVYTRNTAAIKIYDYYYPEKQCKVFYGTGPNTGPAVEYECSDPFRKTECGCLQRICARSWKHHLLKRYRLPPSIRLFRYTMNPDKANYGIRVIIDSVQLDEVKRIHTASATVQQVYKRGIEFLEVKSRINFFWKLHCTHPSLEEGHVYYIIAHDGNVFMDKHGNKVYRYPLMGTAIILEKPSKADRKYNRIMTNFEKFLGDRLL